jgi:tight adherence protein B
MTPLLPAIAGALVVAGLIGLTLGLRRTPPPPPTPRLARPGLARIAAVTPRTRALLLAGLTAGVVVAVLTGWWVAALVLPAAAAGLPVLLSRRRPPPGSTGSRRWRSGPAPCPGS